ncbi:SusC/RagA family TonB-linked outer membrane protein [Flavihumibacter petaseus]|nr:SusC/RagA family TonB-linked outer membrane protein [Flavihumibacter petaseus]
MSKLILHTRARPHLCRILLFLLLLTTLTGRAQTSPVYTVGFDQAPLRDVLSRVTQLSKIGFSYDEATIDLNRRISIPNGKYSLRELVEKVCSQANLEFKVNENSISLKNRGGKSSVITGTVRDNGGHPIPDVTVENHQSHQSTSTDSKGNFSIGASPQDELGFSHVSFEEKSFIVHNMNRPMTITMGSGTQNLNEVVVTSLGIKREKKALGYSVGEVKGSEIDKAKELNVVNSLAGRVPGLIVNNTAGGPMGSSKVVIRGSTDITGSNQPLYVVDGVPMDNSNYGMTGNDKYASGQDLGDAISGINADDIETITVLKGPAASALYGSRAGHGVILITTKKGVNKKALGVEVNSTATAETLLTRFDDYQYEYGQGTAGTIPRDVAMSRNTLFSNFGARLDPNLQIPAFYGGTSSYGLVPNNIENFFQTGSSFNNNIAVTGGSDKSNFRFSYNNLRYNDVVPNTYMNRQNFMLQGSSDITPQINLSVRANYMKEHVNNRPALADDAANIGFNFVGLGNNMDQETFKSHYQDEFGNYIEWGGGQYRLNPYWVINRMKNTTDKDRIMGALQLTYNPTTWLSVLGRANTDFTFLDYEKFSPRTTPGAESGVLEGRKSKFSTTTADFLVTAKKQLNNAFYASASVGGSILYINSPSTAFRGEDMKLTDAISFNSFKKQTVVETPYEKQINSFYGMISASYKNYLFLDATLRRDATSTLPPEFNTYWYPSVGMSFVITDALPNLKGKTISHAKVRASAAEVGNDTDPYQLGLFYGLDQFQPADVTVGGIINQTLPNRQLKPTRTRSFEAGLDVGFFNNRIGFEFTYYTQDSRDQINFSDIPTTSGYGKYILNAGNLTNRGVELLLNTKPIVGKAFSWDLSLNAAHNKNIVQSLAPEVTYLTLSEARWLGLSVIAQPGMPFGSIIGYDYQRAPDGQVILDPINLTPLSTSDRKVLGKGTWDWTGGMINTFRYKNLSLTAVIDVKYGADLFSMTNLFAVIRGQEKSTLAGRKEWIRSEEDRQAANMTPAEWQASGNMQGYVPQGVVQTGVDADGKPVYEKNTKPVDPNVFFASFYGDDRGVAVPFIYDASYVKMRELTLTYALPTNISRKIRAQLISISFVARNPFIIYKNVPNVDPDSNYNNGNGQGFEYGSLPGRRSWGGNLNIRF